ncbi:hypothetical protein FNAPI_5289 [Fusarium napiforme]|uniref:PH domain-containing protein n=1 Tax=Fusarium napiforme TaxID=42672 RepID=A0A8H5N8Y3_9HYPO|nr:hypothetical protein FNAPI_5289 [Fusarium napiforme]
MESQDWIKAIRKATTHHKTAFDKNLRGTGGQRTLRTLPLSESCFKDIAKKFYIHDSINRVVSRANVSQFSAVKLQMGKHEGHELPAHVYSARTSNAWDGDLAVSATYFPNCRLTFAVMFGCPLSVEAEILTRLETATYEICHPLLVPSMLVEIERRRHLPIIDDTLDEIEARFLELDDPESLQHITEAEKLTRKEAKRSSWLDILYLRNQLMSWNTCLEALYEHTEQLSRTTFRDINIPSVLKPPSSDDFTIHGDSSSDSGADWNAPIGELSLANSAKIQARLREVIKDYNEKIRECTAGFEGMAMTTQWAQGETNVEIALATSQDSRHMKSIALVTMLFLPGTFFASMFSMGFFEWKPEYGTVTVFKSFCVYAVLAAGFTAITLGVWCWKKTILKSEVIEPSSTPDGEGFGRQNDQKDTMDDSGL